MQTNVKMPVLFIGHGSPMLAIEDNPFTPKWREAAENMPKPRAVLCISAHWETLNIAETGSTDPGLVYDFYGFPPALYRVQYPVQADLALASEIQTLLHEIVPVQEDVERGFDHGSWTVMKHMYPKADVPLIQLSLCRRLTPQSHIILAKKLAQLREQGVLIIGSGNLVHNLRLLDWQHMNDADYAFDWARRAQKTLLDLVIKNDIAALADFAALGEDVAKAVNSAEHFLPLLYVLALREENEHIRIFNQQFVGGSLDMTCVEIGGEMAA
ncbi:dioxygenase [Snodgrassella sp. CFCC 13594]|uniref:4,5-DOPA-extradiol-dioxygenase n=1 Tax=Snodgrassella sp. CFCC 13594 TaxID=1775559 RepID=UPI000830C680|nr:class III extradiol ring-cleavage dioxygenase [Snodgrassella sp. CFCC 13594]